MTIHESKLNLKQLRYLENHEKCIDTLSKIITFDLTIGFSISLVFWKLEIQRFLETPRSTQSESEKALKYASKVELGKGQNC